MKGVPEDQLTAFKMSGVTTPAALAFEVAAPWVEWAEKVNASIPKPP